MPVARPATTADRFLSAEGSCRVFSLVHHTHPTDTQLFDDAVMRDGLADHWAEMLGLAPGQVNEGGELAVVPRGQLLQHRDNAQSPQ